MPTDVATMADQRVQQRAAGASFWCLVQVCNKTSVQPAALLTHLFIVIPRCRLARAQHGLQRDLFNISEAVVALQFRPSYMLLSGKAVRTHEVGVALKPRRCVETCSRQLNCCDKLSHAPNTKTLAEPELKNMNTSCAAVTCIGC